MSEPVAQKTIAVFSTNDIFISRPVFRDQKPKCMLCGDKCFSTGRLEQAVSGGYEVFVVSIRIALAVRRERWWMQHVKKENIFLTERGAQHCSSPELIAPWQRLAKRLNVAWPQTIGSIMDAKDYMLGLPFVLSAKDFKGFKVK